MPFILFLIVILLLVNGVSIFKFMYRMALFTIMIAIAGLASYFFFSVNKAEALSDLEAAVPAEVITIPQGQRSNQLKQEIAALRVEIKQSDNLAEKKMLSKHLQHLEGLLARQADEKAAIENMKEDRKKIKELQKLRESLNERKQQFKRDAKRLEELNKEIKRSEMLIEKLNALNESEKGIQHD